MKRNLAGTREELTPEAQRAPVQVHGAAGMMPPKPGDPVFARTRLLSKIAADERGGHNGSRHQPDRHRAVGRYRLDSKLGSGGMTVYLASDETLQRWVAVKVMHREISDQPDQLERFRREARADAQLSHANVVAVIDAGEDGGYPYTVLEYVEGETLKQRIDRLGRLPVDEAAAYGIEIGRGLAAAHAQRLIHRDVKPQNVLIDSDGRAKVTDFGIARSLDGATGSPRRTLSRRWAGRRRPHRHLARRPLYEMLTGEVVGRTPGWGRDEARQRADAGRPGAPPQPRRSPR